MVLLQDRDGVAAWLSRPRAGARGSVRAQRVRSVPRPWDDEAGQAGFKFTAVTWTGQPEDSDAGEHVRGSWASGSDGSDFAWLYPAQARLGQRTVSNGRASLSQPNRLLRNVSGRGCGVSRRLLIFLNSPGDQLSRIRSCSYH
jgi:hypothetical protein